MSSISKLRAITTRQDKVFLLVLLFMSIVLSLIETVGISAIMPFITLASDPSKILQNEYSRAVYNFFGFKNTVDFMIFFGVTLILFYLFRAAYSIFYGYLLNKFSFVRHHIFAYRLFKNYVSLPYREFVKRNTAELTRTIVGEASNLTSYIQNLLMMMSEIFTIVFLYGLLLLVNWKMTLVLSVFLGVKVLFLTKTISRVVKAQGVKRAELYAKFYRILNETFGNFKIIKLTQNEEKIFDDFSITSQGYARANIINATLGQTPRITLETLGFSILVAVVVYILLRYQNANFVLPIISMYALALYRMLPAINRVLGNYNGMLFISKSLDIVHEELSYFQPVEGNENISFKNSIVINGIFFEYIKDKPVLENINLEINRGEKIAFVGESGSGKSTLVDLIIGVYRPKAGEIFIDGVELSDGNIRSWRSKIGYIPQSIYLFDGSVGQNVAFGYEYDEQRIIDALKKANIYDFLLQKDGIDTKVGEGGIQLSGGQKQRIGIARALYSNPEILVLDEATSALDNETEAKIMDEIYSASEGKTLLVIAHRLSTVERCDRKINMSNGRIVNE
ncbi:MAG: ATP-binding cassette domain-containing protein [Campylobacterales bacterium]|nr:ATP-binding cassette domain-containing protein [Campylobacterales bacterium]